MAAQSPSLHAEATPSDVDGSTWPVALPSPLRSSLLKQNMLPTPVQAATLPIGLAHRGPASLPPMLVQAPSGSGKTLCYALLLVSKFRPGDRGVVLLPSRELCAQVEQEFQGLEKMWTEAGGGVGRAGVAEGEQEVRWGVREWRRIFQIFILDRSWNRKAVGSNPGGGGFYFRKIFFFNL